MAEIGGVLTREAVIDAVVKGMLAAKPLTPADIRNCFGLLHGTVDRMFGEPVTWDEIVASEARVKEAKRKAVEEPMIHPSFWGPVEEVGE